MCGRKFDLHELPLPAYCGGVKCAMGLFGEAFPGRRCGAFFRQLNKIVKRELSFADRDKIIKASLRLVERKKNATTAEVFRSQLSWENEDKKKLVATLEKIHSLADDLIISIELLEDDNWSIDFEEKDAFLIALYRPFDARSSIAPVEQVLN